MASIGRNERCPCGSGQKYKKCCLAKKTAGGGFTREDRASVLGRLSALSDEELGDEDDAAYEELLGERYERWLEVGDAWSGMDEAFHDSWFWYDRRLADGRTIAERFIEEAALSAGERRFLDLACASCVRLYEVIDTRPGLSVTLREVLDGTQVTVRERTGSRTMRRADLLAARVFSMGASGEPEIEMGVLSIPTLIRGELVDRLTSMRESFRREDPGATEAAFWKSAAAVFHGVWVSSILDPWVPRLANTDGEPMLLTRAHFAVRESFDAARAFDGVAGLDLDTEPARWCWSGSNAAGKLVTLGTVALVGSHLVLETNSAERAARGRTMLEGLCGDAITHTATSHEDPTLGIQDTLRSRGESEPASEGGRGVPAEVIEDVILSQYGRHYRAWVDEPVPALDGKTPREAAAHPRWRSKVEGLIRELEGMYQHALAHNEPAYDPSWMWAEIGLVDASSPAQLPPLHHERLSDMVSGFGECARSVAARLRGPTGDASGTFTREQLAVDLDLRRFLRDAEARSADEGGGRDALAKHLACVINFEAHRRKTFRVDEALAYLLSRTDLDVLGRELRLPFDCLALIFTDRQVLSLAERLLARDASCPLAGAFLRVSTVYVTEEIVATGRALRLVFALDALGADLPYLVEHLMTLRDDGPIDLPPSGERAFVAPEGEGVYAPMRPLRGLVQVVLNALLYATSAGVEPRVLPRPRASGGASVSSDANAPISDEVYFLPGTIPISRLRQMQELERAPGGRGLLHRFLVRGHWRRPSSGWKDQRMRWIEPYWKGPDLAAVIERAYKLKP